MKTLNYNQDQENQQRKDIIAALAVNYPTLGLSSETYAAFARALRDVPIPKLQKICDYWAETQADFPRSPADLKIRLQEISEMSIKNEEQAEKERLQQQRTNKCPFCDEVGWRYFIQDGKRTARRCTHKKDTEAQFHGALKGKTPGLQAIAMPVKIKELETKLGKKVEWK